MFIYFNENKLAYHKGQLAPFFIAFIILLLIAALVTVNIGKVGLIKTHSSNAADAGALAGGSVMATVFNAQAVMNSEMIAAYELFYVQMALLTEIARAAMWAAVFGCGTTCYPCWGSCCCGESPVCSYSAGLAITALTSAIIVLIAFQIQQYYYYKIMKEQAMDGRESAIEAAYRFAFLNSGISSKLKSCGLEDTSLCDGCDDGCNEDCESECGDKDDYDDEEEYYDCTDTCSRTDLNCSIDNCDSQRAEFQLWLKDIESASTTEYSWVDGQERSHQVSVEADTEEVGVYELKVPALPTVALVGLLYISILKAKATELECAYCYCATGVVAAGAGWVTGFTLAALAGLIPAWSLEASGFALVMFPICWIMDIDHDRLFSVTTWQEHEGQDYGVMGQTTYPRVESYSQTDFSGSGEIYSPDPSFDASIIKTDELTGE